MRSRAAFPLAASVALLGIALAAMRPASAGSATASGQQPPSAGTVAGPRGAGDAVDPSEGLATMREVHCHLCHEVPEVEPAPRIASCADCHAWIREVADDPVKRARAMQVFPLWERYERSVASYLAVPSLEAAMARLDPDWVRDYLADPHDLRPGMPETMPRFDLSSDQLDAIVASFAAARARVPATPSPDPARVERGRAVFERTCASCHPFGARAAGGDPRAPDLAHARDRMSADHVAAWIADPAAVSPRATMPAPDLEPAEVLAVRDYVLLADPAWTPAPPAGPPPGPTTEPVAWADVEERVFGRICVHCHMDPEANEGRAGPGNGGGFGWPATGIELETYEGVVAAADRIPASLLRRRAEAHRDAVDPGQQPVDLTRPARPGMPLALPPLPDEDIALVLGWIEEGMPR